MESPFAVTVFASSSERVDSIYFDAARQLGHAIAQSGWQLVYGGNRVGPMGAMADAARAAGGRVLGVTPQLFIDAGHGDHDCHELCIADSMRHRKQIMDERCDAFITLPGGMGTLEEFFEAVVGRQLNLHGKPVVLINLDGFYEPLLVMIHAGVARGFIRKSAWANVSVVDTVNDALAVLAEGRVHRGT